jgi:hypothetical protein
MIKARIIRKIGRAMSPNAPGFHEVHPVVEKPLTVLMSWEGAISRLFALLVLLAWPKTPALCAAAQGPPRPAQLTLTHKTDSSVTLAWTTPTNGTAVSAYDVFGNDVLIGASTSNSLECTGLTQDRAYVFRVRSRDAAGNVSDPSNALLATPQAGNPLVQPVLVRTQFHALVLNYDAHIWVDGAYVRASDYYLFRDVGKLMDQYINLLRRASGGQTIWSVADRYDLDEFGPSATPSQPVFDSTNYATLRTQGYSYDV